MKVERELYVQIYYYFITETLIWKIWWRVRRINMRSVKRLLQWSNKRMPAWTHIVVSGANQILEIFGDRNSRAFCLDLRKGDYSSSQSSRQDGGTSSLIALEVTFMLKWEIIYKSLQCRREFWTWNKICKFFSLGSKWEENTVWRSRIKDWRN